MLNLFRNSRLFPKVAAPCDSPTDTGRRFSFLHVLAGPRGSSPSLALVSDYSIRGVKWQLILGLIFVLLVANVVLNFLSRAFWPHRISVCSDPWPVFFAGLLVFFIY